MLEPIHLYQLVIDGLPREFSPLKSLHRSNLPIAAWPMLGRDEELAALRTLVADGARLITLTGPGGTGKTRLALQAAAELSDPFTGGTFFVALAALREPADVRPEVAKALGLTRDDDVDALLRAAPVLLILDNLEQLKGVASVVAELLVGDTVVVATSRAPLHLTAERELPVPPLDTAPAVELFLSRAAAVGRRLEGDPTVAAICQRLDNLPLAIELAAARTRLLTPGALLERLETSLPMLSGGAHDLPERQRTLRATIAWSYDLLDELQQVALRRLSVFRGSFTLDDAEAVTGASLDEIEGLVDQSLVVAQLSGLCLLLETVREFARERLEEAGETREYDLRHAHHFLDALGANETVRQTERGAEAVAWYRQEEQNLGTMLDRLSTYEPVEAARAACLLNPYWTRSGAAIEARTRLLAILTLDLPDASRARVLYSLANVEDQLNELDAAYAHAREAVDLAEAAEAPALVVDSLGMLATAAGGLGHVDEAIRVANRAVGMAEELDPTTRLHALHDLGGVLAMAGRVDEARVTLRRAADESNHVGHAIAEMYSWNNIGLLELGEREFVAARVALDRAMDLSRRVVDHNIATSSLLGLGYAELGLGQPREARAHFAAMLDLVLAAANLMPADFGNAAYGIALAADPARSRDSVLLRRRVTALRDREGLGSNAQVEALELAFTERLGGAEPKDAGADGPAMSYEEMVQLAAVARSGGVRRTTGGLRFGCIGNQRLTHATASGILGGLMTHTTLSWKMCMRGRPRRAEDGRRDFPR